ncbi:pyrroloquinoline quinone biosynthesis protein PqqE [Rhizosaccharibacter radicis]|uniref:PqqA peptide cyclase n=1 Tax=Rhizosaccharibacter radicis TaxID=2782605 RepID=A0ABT1W1C1_9PROT|nr:pyrroloquinoline quinone biosynthesis protein PqqE [Acetobacteraceae bacterium KSS12]
MSLLAELTHRCPLSCPYCSNPLTLDAPAGELSTAEWCDLFDQAAALGVLQLHLSGGEPMARRDLPALVSHAARAGLYTNLITSGVHLTADRARELAAAGLDHLQLSFQHADAAEADRIGGMRGAHGRKLEAAAHARAAGIPLTVNLVVHRQNIGAIAAVAAMAAALGAGRLEVAHVQYYGWGLLNRASLLPDAAELAAATAAVEAARAAHAGRMLIDYVTPDYHADRPKPCMGGWGRRFLNITPSGRALPCHAAETIPGLDFPSVRDQALAAIWRDDPAFHRFRGTEWMPDTCRSCDRRELDWGGCRCQALALAGDAAAMDPVCGRSDRHHVVRAAVADRPGLPPPFRYRQAPGRVAAGG